MYKKKKKIDSKIISVSNMKLQYMQKKHFNFTCNKEFLFLFQLRTMTQSMSMKGVIMRRKMRVLCQGNQGNGMYKAKNEH